MCCLNNVVVFVLDFIFELIFILGSSVLLEAQSPHVCMRNAAYIFLQWQILFPVETADSNSGLGSVVTVKGRSHHQRSSSIEGHLLQQKKCCGSGNLPICHAYLNQISSKYQTNLRKISWISHGFLSDISRIYVTNIRHISLITHVCFWRITGNS